MFKPRSDLLCGANWQVVLPLLDIAVESAALPARCQCPLCRGSRLSIFADGSNDGQWHYCYDCGSKGDMITLAARVWRLPTNETILRLLASGIHLPATTTAEAETADYLDRLSYLEAFDKTRDDNRDYLLQSSELRALCERLGFTCAATDRAWLEGPGQIMFGVNSRLIELCFAPKEALNGGNAYVKSRVINNPGDLRLFVGPNWKDVVIVPFYHLPGKLAAMWGIGRKGNLTSDVVYKRLRYQTEDGEAGLAGHPSTFDKINTPVLCIGDPINYIRLHLRNFSVASEPLPLVLWRSDDKCATRTSWQIVDRREKVFWAVELNAATLHQAIMTDGRIFIPRVRTPTRDTVRQHLNRLSPAEHVADAFRRAKHWSVVLDELAAEAPVEQLDGMLLALKQRGLDMEQVVSACTANTQRVCGDLLRSGSGRQVRMGAQLIRERNNGWYIEDRSRRAGRGQVEVGDRVAQLLTDARLYIDDIVRFKSSPSILYRGRILYRGNELPFCDERDNVETNTANWLKEQVIQAGHGVPRINKSSRKVGSLTDIALLFNSPTISYGVETIGWDAATSSFQLPHIVITNTGRIERQTRIADQKVAAGADIGIPPEIGPDMLGALLEQTAGNQAFWALWLAITTNILAPAFAEETRGIAVYGKNSIAAAKAAAKATGLEILSPHDTPTHALVVAESRHRWPLAVGIASYASAAQMQPFLEHDAPTRNCVAVVNPVQGLGCMLRSGWWLIGDDEMRDVNPKHASATWLLPHYLQRVTANAFSLRTSAGTLLEHIAGDVCVWLEENYGCPDVVHKAVGSIRKQETESPIALFGELLYHLIERGWVGLSRPGFKTGDVFTVLDDGIFIPKREFNVMLESKGNLSIDGTFISRILSESGQLIGETKHRGLSGWLVDARWLYSLHAGLPTAHSLRIAG